MLAFVMLLVMSGLLVMLLAPRFGVGLLGSRLRRRMLSHRCHFRTGTRRHFLMPCLRLSLRLRAFWRVELAAWLRRARHTSVRPHAVVRTHTSVPMLKRRLMLLSRLLLRHRQMLLCRLHVHRRRAMFLHLLRHMWLLALLLAEIMLRHSLWLRTM